MPVSLKDVAAHAKVSPATVSGVINRRSYCWASEETSERVMRSVQELGYTPNRAARGLRLKQFMTIGVIVPDLANPFYVALVRALTDRLNKAGYAVVIEDNAANLENERQSFDRILDRQVDGIFATMIDVDSFSRQFKKTTPAKPVLLFGGAPPDAVADSVTVDMTPGLSAAVDHLVAHGHRRIAFFAGKLGGVAFGGKRFRAITAALKRHNLQVPPELRLISEISLSSGFETFDSFLTNRPRADWPTAVIAINDWLAIAATGAARRHGLRVPEDLSVVGVDNIDLCRYLPVPLSTISHPLEEIADTAVTLMLERVAGRRKRKTTRVNFSATFLPRQSTGPVHQE